MCKPRPCFIANLEWKRTGFQEIEGKESGGGAFLFEKGGVGKV